MPDGPVADLKALGAQRDRLRAENERRREARCQHCPNLADVIERCARALWEQNGVKWREHYPWDSTDPIAIDARERAMEQARIVLDVADHQGAVEAEREWCEAIIDVDTRDNGDGRLLATLANMAATRLRELGGQSSARAVSREKEDTR